MPLPAFHTPRLRPAASLSLEAGALAATQCGHSLSAALLALPWPSDPGGHQAPDHLLSLGTTLGASSRWPCVSLSWPARPVPDLLFSQDFIADFIFSPKPSASHLTLIFSVFNSDLLPVLALCWDKSLDFPFLRVFQLCFPSCLHAPPSL